MFLHSGRSFHFGRHLLLLVLLQCACTYLRPVAASTYSGALTIHSPCGNYSSPSTRLTISDELDVSVDPELPSYLTLILTTAASGYLSCVLSTDRVSFRANIADEKAVFTSISSSSTDDGATTSTSISAAQSPTKSGGAEKSYSLSFDGTIELITATKATDAPNFIYSSPSPSSSSSSIAGLGHGALVGIIVAGVAAGVIIMCLLWWCILRRRRRREEGKVYPELAYIYNPVPSPTPPPMGGSRRGAKGRWTGSIEERSEMEGSYPGGWVEGKGGKNRWSMGVWGRWRVR